MKTNKIFLFVFFIMALSGFVHAQEQWVVVFEDEFEGNSLDREQWNVMPFGAHTLYCNELAGVEHQYYSDDYNSIEVSNGTLKLIARKHDPAIPKKIIDHLDPGAMLECSEGEIQNLRAFSYTSGMIESKRAFVKGMYEIICKMPVVEDNRLFPAFWLYGQCSQEVDIFEFRDSKVHDPLFNQSNNSDLHPFYTVWKSKICDGDRGKFQEIDNVGFPITQVWAI